MKIESDLSKYYDSETEFNESTFDGDKFEEAVWKVLKDNDIPIDDYYSFGVGYQEDVQDRDHKFLVLGDFRFVLNKDEVTLSRSYIRKIENMLSEAFSDVKDIVVSVYKEREDDFIIHLYLKVRYKLYDDGNEEGYH